MLFIDLKFVLVEVGPSSVHANVCSCPLAVPQCSKSLTGLGEDSSTAGHKMIETTLVLPEIACV